LSRVARDASGAVAIGVVDLEMRPDRVLTPVVVFGVAVRLLMLKLMVKLPALWLMSFLMPRLDYASCATLELEEAAGSACQLSTSEEAKAEEVRAAEELPSCARGAATVAPITLSKPILLRLSTLNASD